MSDDTRGDQELLAAVSHVQWGYMDDGIFVSVPKLPLIRAGFRNPPFSLTVRGKLRNFEERPIPDEPSSVPQSVQVLPAAALETKSVIKVSRKIKVYTASKLRFASYIRNDICQWPEVEVTSRWPFAHVDGDDPLWPEDCAAHGSIFWTHDEEDVRAADVVLLFGSENDVLRGGLVEAGIAIGLGKRVIVVGQNPSYGTWQYHPLVYRVKDMQAARSFLSLLAVHMNGK